MTRTRPRIAIAFVLTVAGLAALAQATSPGTNGQIVYARFRRCG